MHTRFVGEREAPPGATPGASLFALAPRLLAKSAGSVPKMRKSPHLGEVLRIPLLPLNPPFGQFAVRLVKERRRQKTLTGVPDP